MYDLIVLGGSIAGTTAAVYAVRRNLNILLITTDIGGEISTTPTIENWPGENSISGFDFSQKIESQLKYNNIPTVLGQKVTKITPQDNFFVVTATDFSGKESTYEAKAVTIATGAHPKYLGVKGEEAFMHKGVTYCATCDAPLFKNKIVAVVGGGNSALTSALMLADIASQVYLITKYPAMKGESILIEKADENPKIQLITEAQTKEVIGEKMVNGLIYTDKSGEEKKLDVQGVFVHVGLAPNSTFIDIVDKGKSGEIIIDRSGRTSTPGIFAAGDVTDTPYKQIVIAAGLGCASTLAAIDYLNAKK